VRRRRSSEPTRLGRRAGSLVAALIAGAAPAVLGSAAPAVAATFWTVGLGSGSHAEAKGENAPAAPTGVTAACQGLLLNGNVVVTWSPVTHASAYQVYQATSSGGTYTAKGATVATTTATVAPGALGSFFFKVQAIGGTHWAGPLSAFAGPRTIVIGLICT
jgi:hypothetical protein